MDAKRIAIIGNIDPTRAEELDLLNTSVMAQAAEELGMQLAANGYDLVVFSAAKGALEVDVVRGYTSFEDTRDKSIHVVHSNADKTPPVYDESKTHDALFKYEPDGDPNWVTSYYQSLMGTKVDGAVLVGGGRATLIAGLVVAGMRKPILTVGHFGGTSKQLWQRFSQQKLDYIPQKQWSILGGNMWSSSNAHDLVDLLSEQFNRLEEINMQDTAPKREQASNRYSLIAVPLLIAIVVAWVVSQSITQISPTWLYILLGIVPIAGGIVGSSARVLLSEFQGTSSEDLPRLSQNLTLGLIAGVISAFIFLGAQVSSLSTLELEPGQLAQQLKPLILYTALVSMAGGFALEDVFGRLREIHPDETVTSLSARPNTVPNSEAD